MSWKPKEILEHKKKLDEFVQNHKDRGILLLSNNENFELNINQEGIYDDLGRHLFLLTELRVLLKMFNRCPVGSLSSEKQELYISLVNLYDLLKTFLDYLDKGDGFIYQTRLAPCKFDFHDEHFVEENLRFVGNSVLEVKKIGQFDEVKARKETLEMLSLAHDCVELLECYTGGEKTEDLGVAKKNGFKWSSVGAVLFFQGKEILMQPTSKPNNGVRLMNILTKQEGKVIYKDELVDLWLEGCKVSSDERKKMESTIQNAKDMINEKVAMDTTIKDFIARGGPDEIRINPKYF